MTDNASTPPRDEHDSERLLALTIAAAALEFPSIELPPPPNFGLPRRMDPDLFEDDLAGLPPVMTPNVDEPEGEWKSPFPDPEPSSSYALQIAPAADETLPEPMNSPWIGAVPETANPHAASVPVPVPAPPTAAEVEPEVTIEPTGIAPVAVIAFGALAVFLVWASGYAFSAALMGLAAIITAELAGALALADGRSQPADIKAKALAGVGIVVALIAAKRGIAELGPDAVVGGLFVIVALVPTLLVIAIAHLILRRRADRATAADHALLHASRLRLLALLAVGVAGIVAHISWASKPDAIVAIVLLALAILTALPVLRGAAPARLTRD
ncbi:MAG: hypothetical protein ABI200_05925 [Gaiellales bacterium]